MIISVSVVHPQGKRGTESHLTVFHCELAANNSNQPYKHCHHTHCSYKDIFLASCIMHWDGCDTRSVDKLQATACIVTELSLFAEIKLLLN